MPSAPWFASLSWSTMSIYRVEQKNLAKFSDTGSARARGLCIGSPRLVGGRKAGNSNMQDFFLHHTVRRNPPRWRGMVFIGVINTTQVDSKSAIYCHEVFFVPIKSLPCMWLSGKRSMQSLTQVSLILLVIYFDMMVIALAMYLGPCWTSCMLPRIMVWN